MAKITWKCFVIFILHLRHISEHSIIHYRLRLRNVNVSWNGLNHSFSHSPFPHTPVVSIAPCSWDLKLLINNASSLQQHGFDFWSGVVLWGGWRRVPTVKRPSQTDAKVTVWPSHWRSYRAGSLTGELLYTLVLPSFEQ